MANAQASLPSKLVEDGSFGVRTASKNARGIGQVGGPKRMMFIVNLDNKELLNC
jgi:hypothetical protein